MTASFEFLANFQDWREECRKKNARVDVFPASSAAGQSCGLRAAHAALLKTLTVYEETAGEAREGFSRLVSNKACGLADDWKDWLLPGLSDLSCLPDGSCLIRVEATLRSPFFSRDDRSFYPTDNVLKRHHVFLTPYLAASGLKGLLRWAWNMSGGSEEDAALLFGKAAAAAGEDSRQGLLYLWPVYWKGKVGLDVINPQDRFTGTGTVPVRYEVVLPKSSGSVCLLLVNEGNVVPRLLLPLMRAFWHLVDYGGLSARSSAGWGQVECEKCCCAVKGVPSRAQKERRRADEEKMAESIAQQNADRERWKDVLDASGELVPFDPALFTKNRLEKLGINSTKFKKVYGRDAQKAYEVIKKKGEWRVAGAAQPPAVAPVEEKSFPTDWLVKDSSRKAFVAELEACVQELATWLK